MAPINRHKIVKDIVNTRIYDLVREVPLEHATGLSQVTRNDVYLKREDLQPVFSFKIRGAYHKMRKMPTTALRKGVIAASAGNHAQGVALAAQKLGYKATIVMPKHTQNIKIEAVKSYGARTVLHGDGVEEATARALEMAGRNGAVFFHPFDDLDIIAGQGTVAAEILRQNPDPIHAIFVAIGGGGLISGIASYIKTMRPEIKVIGVEPSESACMKQAIEKDRPVDLKHVGIFADAVAVRKAGRHTFQICRELVDEIITVSNDQICSGIKDIYQENRTVVEPAGALGVAGIKAYAERERLRGKRLVTLTCGANMNFDRLRFIAERADIGENREALIAATLMEKPGSFNHFCELIGQRNVTEFNYRISDSKIAHVFAGIEISSVAETSRLIRQLKKAGIEALDLSDNELAKLHVRHMVGGRAPLADHEVLFRFEFPERPGALMNFLSKAGKLWNISLFHYRNHGSDYGRVLAGLQVPPADRRKLHKCLAEIGYPYREESDNPAYDLFLSKPNGA